MQTPLQSALRTSCVLTVALLAQGAVKIHGQANLQQVIAQKNAEAAAATWGYLDGVPSNFAPRPDPNGSSPTPQPFDPSAKAGSSSGSASTGASQPDAKRPDSNATVSNAGVRAASENSSNEKTAGQGTPAVRADLPSTPVSTDDNVVSRLPPQRAKVSYSNGLLEISSNNASLNQILWAIEARTGMKVTGGVHDQRVFGHYGPALPADILVTLLDGTGTNILFLEGGPSSKMELIMTARGGGQTPRSPNASDDMPNDMSSVSTSEHQIP